MKTPYFHLNERPCIYYNTGLESEQMPCTKTFPLILRVSGQENKYKNSGPVP